MRVRAENIVKTIGKDLFFYTAIIFSMQKLTQEKRNHCKSLNVQLQVNSVGHSSVKNEKGRV